MNDRKDLGVVTQTQRCDSAVLTRTSASERSASCLRRLTKEGGSNNLPSSKWTSAATSSS